MQNSPEYLLAPYCDLGLSADRSIDLPWGTLRLQVQVLNILDVQYEVVRSYPMMGRNVRFKVSFEL
jgi:outer membrane cobalamin receptor